MKFAHFFINRPIFASVISILTVIVGILSYYKLPVEQYPQVVPPTIEVSASYPGANAETVAKTVATPIEQEINGVEGMLYMESQSTADGQMNLTITFELGTDLDEAQILVQNRVAIAEPRLPEEVRRLGVTTSKNSPNMLMVINLYSPDRTYDQVYMANYVILHIQDKLQRIQGVGDIGIYGAAPYSMRIWLDPDLIQSFNLTAGEVLQALRSQNIQVASGILNQSPQPRQLAFELSLQTQGRLIEPQEFEDIIVKSGDDGRIVRIRDVGRVELDAQSYITRGFLGVDPAVAVPVMQRPGSNAIATSKEVIQTMEEAAKDFPAGLAYDIVYNPTNYVEESVNAVLFTIFEAVILVVLVIVVFLQTWRAAIIPILAIPVSLIGTFIVMHALGLSLNTLTLFGLVLCIGIVVDDAIVVVENLERNLRKGLKPKDAAKKTMDEVGSSLIAMGLVLVAVFMPAIFLEGISGKFYQQFGIVVAVATMISVFVSLTLSPALAAILMRHEERHPDNKYNVIARGIHAFFDFFNIALEWATIRYTRLISKVVHLGLRMVVIYAGLMALTGVLFNQVPQGFIPPQDQGYFIIAVQLPSGASLSRTSEVMETINAKLLQIDGVMNSASFAGFSGATFTTASNAGAIFPVLESYEIRRKKGLSYDTILADLRQAMASIKDAFIIVIPPPPVQGVGNTGGFSMMVQDIKGRGLEALEQATWALAGAANQSPITTSVFTLFENSTPQLYLDIDREKALRLGVPVSNIFEALEIYIGSAFVNDFNFLGRTFRVTAQADAPYRLKAEDALNIRVRNKYADMVPIGSVATIHDIAGPSRIGRYNLYNAAALMGDTKPGYSTGEALAEMERLAKQVLPDGIGYEWTGLSYQEKSTGNTAAMAFILAVVFVFLLLAAQYESWVLPLAIILIVPMCLFSSIMGIGLAGMDNDILAQIGFVILIGLATKNAILIVQFARELESQGKTRFEAAVEAARLRLRPILMTSFAFILGVVPLVLAKGAGAEMRRSLGVAVFSGMLGVTFFGILFTPVFYVLCRKLSFIFKKSSSKEGGHGDYAQ